MGIADVQRHNHFSTEVVRETTVGVKDREVCTTDVADTQFLVARSS